MPKMNVYVKTFKLKKEIKIKTINHKKLLEKYKATWTKIKDLQKNELNALTVYDDRYIKTKIRTYGDKVYTNFRGLNVAEDDIEHESFTVISIDSLLLFDNKLLSASIF